jgi:predicted Zn-dependent protease
LSYFADARATTGDLASAVAAIQEALRRAPYEPGLNAKLGDLMRREGRMSDAYYALIYEVVLHGVESRFARPAMSMQEELLRTANDLHKDHDHTERPTPATPAARAEADAHEILAVAKGLRALDAGSTHSAAKLFEHALSGTRSSSPLPYILYADALLRDKQADKAQQTIDLALQAHPDCVPALWVLQDAQRAQGQTAKADATRAKIQSLYPGYWRLTVSPTGG